MLDSEGDLSGDLAKLMNLQVEMYNSSQMVAEAMASPIAGWDERIKKYVKRVREIALRHSCKGYTITSASLSGFPRPSILRYPTRVCHAGSRHL